MKRTILFLAANPRDTPQRALDEECKAIEHELRLTSGRDAFELVSRWTVSVDDLMRYLNELSPTVLHFSGHASRCAADGGSPTAGAGARDVESRRAAGVVLHGQDRAQHVDVDALARMIKSASPDTRLVVLNACHSAAVADSLCRVVDCVIAVDGALEDDAARSFAVGLYRALGNHCSVGNAFSQAAATLYGKQMPGELVTCRHREGVDPDQMFVASASPERRSTPPGAGPAAPERYDLFLAHPPVNKASAQALYDLLQSDVRVFLACRSLSPSEHREDAIATAQRAARATVLMVSPHASAAWFLGDEILAAMALHRASPDAHRLVAVLLEPGIALPHRLGNVEAIDAATVGFLPGVAVRLRKLVAAMRQDAAPWSAPSGPARDSPARCDHLQLYDRLSQLSETMFEQIVVHAGIDRGSVAPRAAALAERALDVALLAAFDPALFRKVSAELDLRARWTRR
jgi:hypothetical protein